MIIERGKKYFISTWSECDCHLNTCVYDALIRLSGEFVPLSIGVVNRDYSTGMVKVAVVYDESITDDYLRRIEDRALELIKEEFTKAGRVYPKDLPNMRIYRYNDLTNHGYSGSNIRYCFWYKSIMRKEL